MGASSRSAVLAGGLLVATLCFRPAHDAPAGERSTDGAPAPAVSPAFDVGAIIEQVRSAFRFEDRAWTGGRATYAVRVADAGVSFSPVHHADGVPLRGRAATLRTVAVDRGSVSLARSPRPRTAGDGHLTIDRGPVVEHLRNNAAGLEQSWSFDRRPAGCGDLVLQVAVTGHHYTGTTESGLHFADPDTGLGLRYGHGTWIDATGAETAVAARWTGDAIELAVPAPVVDGAAYPAVLDPIISPELAMDEPVVGPIGGYLLDPQLASDGAGTTLVAWSDSRTGVSSDIFVARVDQDGTVLDPSGIPVGVDLPEQQAPAVAFGTSSFLVVWQDRRSGNNDIYGARITPAGDVLDPLGFEISGAAGQQHLADVAFDGTEYLVVWQDERAAIDVYGARVTESGSVLDPAGIAISAASAQERFPAVSALGSEFLVVWQDGRNPGYDIYGTRIADGVVSDPSGIPISTQSAPEVEPDLACDGTGCLAVWQDGAFDLRAARISAAGAVLDPTGVAITSGAELELAPAIAFDGTQYLVVWESANDDHHVWGVRVTTSATLVDVGPIAIATAPAPESRPAVAFDGTSFVVVWMDGRNEWGPSSSDIYGTRVSPAGAVLAPGGVPIATAPGRQLAAATAFDGDNALVVWEEWHPLNGRDIRGVRVDPSGTVLDPSGIDITAAAADQTAPAVTFDGTGFVVVWQDARASDTDIYGARVSVAGSVLDPAGIPISVAALEQSAPALASSGGVSLVTWQDARSGDANIYAARISQTGAVLEPDGIEITTVAGAQGAPAVAATDPGFLVAWQDDRGSDRDIYGARVSQAGVVEDPSGFAIDTDVGDQAAPALAFDGTRFLVVWESGPAGSIDVRGARVSTDGTILDAWGIPIAQDPDDQRSPTVACAPADCLVAWQDRRDGRSDIAAARIDTTGGTIDNGIAISAAPRVAWTPSLVTLDPGRFLIAYSVIVDEDGFVPRIRSRFITTGLAPATVTTDEDSSVTIDLTASLPLSDALTYTVLGQPGHGELTGEAPALTYVPDPDYHGPDGFRYLVSDGTGDTDAATIAITVEPVNDAPVFVSPTPPDATALRVLEGETVRFTIAAEDIDGDALTYSVTPLPPGAVVDAASGDFEWSAGESRTLTLGATDGQATIERTILVEVDPEEVTEEPPPEGCGCASNRGAPAPGSLLLLLFVVTLLRRGRTCRSRPARVTDPSDRATFGGDGVADLAIRTCPAPTPRRP